MARNIPIVIGKYYENFINKQIASGKYNAVIEVVRAYLRYFEQEETRTQSFFYSNIKICIFTYNTSHRYYFWKFFMQQC